MAPIFFGRLQRCGLLGVEAFADTYENQSKATERLGV